MTYVHYSLRHGRVTMEDLSSISRPLHDAVRAEDRTEARVTILFERQLGSTDPAIRQVALQTLLNILNQPGPSRAGDIEFLILETSLTYIPLLLAALPTSPELVQKILHYVATFGRPREVVLALHEALYYTQQRGVDVRPVHGTRGDERARKRLPLHQELLEILRVYIRGASQSTSPLRSEVNRLVIPRLPNARSTATLSALSDAVGRTLSELAPSCSPEVARSILTRTCNLVQVAWTWTHTTADTGGVQKTVLSSLLFGTLETLEKALQAKLLDRWFLHTFPKFNGLHDEPDRDSDASIQLAHDTALLLGYTDDNLKAGICDFEGQWLVGPVASLILFASQCTKLGSTKIAFDDMSKYMPTILAAFRGPSLDSASTLVFYLLHTCTKLQFDVNDARQIVTFLIPIASSCEQATTRTAMLRLLDAVISSQPAVDKLALLGVVFTPEHPYENMRIHGFSIIRRQIGADPAFLCPALLEMFGFLDEFPYKDIAIVGLLESPRLAWIAESLNLLWFIIDVDTDNRSGIRDSGRLTSIKSKWFEPINKLLEQTKKAMQGIEVGEEVKIQFVLDRWEDASIRAGRAIDSVLQA